MLYFTDAEENMKPVNSLHAVADGTLKAITYSRRQFATMALLPIFYQHGYSAFVGGGTETVFDGFRYLTFKLSMCSVQYGMLNVWLKECQVGLITFNNFSLKVGFNKGGNFLIP